MRSPEARWNLMSLSSAASMMDFFEAVSNRVHERASQESFEARDV